MIQEVLNDKLHEYKDVVNLLAMSCFDVVSEIHGDYISPRDPMGCKSYVDKGRNKMWKAKAIDLSPISASYYVNNEYQIIVKAYYEYMARTMNDYMYRIMPTQSVSKLKNRYLGMSRSGKVEDYHKNFKNLFVKMVLEILGGSNIKLDALEGVEKKANIAKQRAYWDYKDDASQLSVFGARADAMKLAIDIAKSMGLKSINMSALYNASNTIDYCAHSCNGNTEGM